MTSKEIREKETAHLTHELAEQQKRLFELRGQAVTEKLEDPSQLRKTRRGIARMKTILRQRELETAKQKAAAAAPAAAAPAAKPKKAKTKKTATAASK
jgi:large subunit ribosomal protein L29